MGVIKGDTRSLDYSSDKQAGGAIGCSNSDSSPSQTPGAINLNRLGCCSGIEFKLLYWGSPMNCYIDPLWQLSLSSLTATQPFSRLEGSFEEGISDTGDCHHDGPYATYSGH